jgi:L-alanine-DL-glutamate epimerase-like enolase superfamily enzyme
MISVFTMHLAAAIPNAGRFMEYSIETRPWEEKLFTTSFNVSDGKIKIPDGPGWGVQIRPEWLEKATYQISESKYEKTII